MVRSIVRSTRWRFATAAIAVGVLASAMFFMAGRASSAPSLPTTTPAALIASVMKALAANPPVSGQIGTHVDLGIPSLPSEDTGLTGSGFAGLLAAVSGDHTLRVWRSRDGFRMNDMLSAAERSIAISRTDAWAWDSQSYTAYHLGPFPADHGATPGERASQLPTALGDPEVLAERALTSIAPTTRVFIGPNASIAGRDAYVLVIEPRTSATLVGRIEIGIDAEARLPLRVAVYARDAGKAAISAQFTSVDFGAIGPSVYRFAPPPGAKVVPIPVGRMRSKSTPAIAPTAGLTASPTTAGDATAHGGPANLGEYVRTFGTGWASIVAYRTPALSQLRSQSRGLDVSALLPYSGPLFSVQLVDRGDHAWLLVGAVPPSSLARVAPDLS